MRKLEDAFGREIKLGDYVSYSVKTSGGMHMRVAKVWKITWQHDRYSVGVIAGGNRWDWNRASGDKWFYGAYKTTLTANSTLLIVTNIPEKLQTVVTEYENRY